LYAHLFGPVPSRRLGMSLGVLILPGYNDSPGELETVLRRPCTVQDMSRILGLHVNEISKYLEVLEKGGKIAPERRERGVFYAGARRVRR